MAVKRTTKPVTSPAGTVRARVKKTTPKKTAARKTTGAAKVVTRSASASTKTTAGAARKATVARMQRLVDETPLVIDDGDDVARSRVAVLRAAKARAPDHQGRAKRSAVERAADPPPAAGRALIERVSRAIERELTQIEVIVGGHYVPPRQRTEAERRARTLASLARTLREVTALRLNEKKEKREDDDAVPRDLSELRLALARRLDQLVADAKTAHPDATE